MKLIKREYLQDLIDIDINFNLVLKRGGNQ